jgi:uncharacterized protein (TIGR02996 family)
MKPSKAAMSRDETTFVRTIAAAGSDSLPRLVFADWLDEHDQPERAQFVRDQVFVSTTPTDSVVRRAAALRASQAERKFARRWAGVVAWHAYDWQFRNGFPDLLGLTAAKFRRNSVALFAHTPVRSLLISELAGRVDWLRAVPPVNGIDRLSLWGARLTGEHVSPLAEALGGLTHLTTLSLLFNNLGDDAIAALIGSPQLRRLARLELGANPFSRTGRDELSAAFGDRVTFECEREDDFLYRIQNDDPFFNGVAPDGTQYVTRDGRNGYEVARFDAAGNVLGVETRAVGDVDDGDDTSFIESLGAREGNVRVKRFRHADGRGIETLPTLNDNFLTPLADRRDDEFAHQVLESWLLVGEFAFGNCILNCAGEVTAT